MMQTYHVFVDNLVNALRNRNKIKDSENMSRNMDT